MRKQSGQPFRLEDYRPADYAIPRTRLHFRLAPAGTRVVSELEVELSPAALHGAPLVLDGDGLKLSAISLDGAALGAGEFEASPVRLVIMRPPASGRFTLHIENELDPEANTALMGLFRSGGNYCTQCEAEGFRRITYFPDRPDVLSVFSVRIEARREEAPVLLSNGNPGSSGPLDEGWHFAEWYDPHPKPSYLFALVAGDLARLGDRFITANGRQVDLGIYVEKGKEDRARYAMDALKRAMRWDEETYGREYDLDVFNIVAVPDFNMGAMENKGLNIFNDKFVLADQATATDTDYANIEAIVAHEYFHNWTGNRITCRDWFQLCLKEGLTVFRDHEFCADQRSRPVKRIAEIRTLRAHQFPEDAGPLAHPVRPRRYREINNFYTATVYEKGSEVVRMIHTLLGPEDFRRGMDLYFGRHDGQAVTIEDFLAVFEEVSGRDLEQFALWYHQAGTPNLSISTAYDEKARSFTVEIEQSVPPTPGESRKRLMHIPLAFGLVGHDGGDVAYQSVEGAKVRDGVIHVVRRRHNIVFGGVRSRPVLSVNRGFSAPVTLSFPQSAADRLFLARKDKDPVSRWLTLNELVTEHLISAARRIRGGKEPDFPPKLTALFGEIAADPALEPAYRALALQLPGESDIAREMGSGIDPDTIFAAREALLSAVARANAEPFEDGLAGMDEQGPFRADAESAGRRALANALVEFLTVAEASPARASARYRTATNMTDRMAALTILAHRFPNASGTVAALADFAERFAFDPIPLDKWFQVQASAPGPNSVEIVRGLSRHPAFSYANPNRVRALFGTFSGANQTGFHRSDGAGYAFFADAVLKVELINPQVAARLATALRSWRSLEPGRREKARETLARLAANGAGSTDLRDIVDRMLA